MDRYKSVQKEALFEFTERKSRFICNVRPVNTDEEASQFIKQISDAHRDAAHNVFAYIVANPVEIQKASDDGEPQGTAGLPVLEVIRKESLTNVCVVVTRYFGGILLGAGGLIRAYSNAARGGLIQAQICNMVRYFKISVTVNYSQLGKVQNTVTSLGNTIINIEYTEHVKMIILSRYDMAGRTIKSIDDITKGESAAVILESCFGKERDEQNG